MKAEWYGIIASGIGSAAACIASGIALFQVRDARRARIGQESPFFPACQVLTLREPYGFVRASNSPETSKDYTDGQPMLLRAENKGGEARYPEISLLAFFPDAQAEYEGSREAERIAIYYPCSQARGGTAERFALRYETVSGAKGEQTFEHLHGLPVLRRVSIK